MPDDPLPGPTPTGFQRTQGGGFKWQPPTAEHLGTLLPQYEIERLLGHGGMGAVYKGRQKSLDRAVAIKILPPGLEEEDASYVERFKNEARVMARLDHPAIVPVYDFGETSEGQLYIVMAFVDGTDVQKMIHQQGRLPPEHALAVTAHVCDALGYAHKHGVVHRDIKPANILINMEGQVKVADFGLAKAQEAGESGLTKTGMAMGTPDYVAPEALMMGVNVDGRADLYAVGVMLYAMLTGNVPRGLFSMPSAMFKDVDPRFDTIVQKSMQMDRDERYQSAAEIRRDLDVILTMPIVQAGGKSSVAIPKQSLPAKPAAKGPQKPMGKSANVPVRSVAGGSDPGSHGSVDQATAAKSKTPLFIGLGLAAAVAVGAFVMMGGKQEAGRAAGPPAAASGSSSSTTPNAALAGASALPSSAPIKVREEPKSPSRSGDTPLANSPSSSTAATTTKSPASTSAASSTPAGSALSPSSTAAVSKSSAPAFPPGQWVKVFTKLEDLPENLRKSDSGMKVEDGWIRRASGNNSHLPLPQNLVGNVGVRFRQRAEWKQKEIAGALYFKTGRDDDMPKEYMMHIDSRAELQAFKVMGEKFLPILTHRLPPELKTLEEIVVEFAIIGDHVVARAGETDVCVVKEPITWKAPCLINLGTAIRDLEVINLEGIPEAEALRILGVDEKGNDLRALAAKQEQQKAEQAKQADAMAAIPELKTLHDQFQKLRAERVTVPFEKDVAALNTSYLGGLDRKIAEEKAAGHLDGVLALEAEKKLIPVVGRLGETAAGDSQTHPAIATMPIPATDEATTPAVLKGLRQIYREAYAKLGATRAANLKALTDPLDKRLAQMETHFTKADRLADAKTVRGYREALNEGRAAAPTATATGPTGTNTSNAALAGASVLPMNPAALALKDNFTNTLGMKFVPLPGTKVLFCIHETRYSDYTAYAAENPGIDGTWKNQSYDGYALTERKEEHPVTRVSWEDAQAFCAWLTKKEGKTYRLPTDEEWSIAVGLGRKEKHGKNVTPDMLSGKENTEFPWGGDYPPKTKDRAGNYSDASRKAKAPAGDSQFLEDYDDGFPTTAPVMSYQPNKLGLYDLGGNVWEWCEDWHDNAQKDRVLRGGSWGYFERDIVLSSIRNRQVPGTRRNDFGFRLVLVPGSASVSAPPPVSPPHSPPALSSIPPLPSPSKTASPTPSA